MLHPCNTNKESTMHSMTSCRGCILVLTAMVGVQAKLREREQQRKERMLLGKTPSSGFMLRGLSSTSMQSSAAAAMASIDYIGVSRSGDNFLAAHFQPQRSESATAGCSAAMISPRFNPDPLHPVLFYHALLACVSA